MTLLWHDIDFQRNEISVTRSIVFQVVGPCKTGGSKVVTPLNPAKWRLVDHNSTVSLSPSIGLGALPCRSHYWIRRSRIDWYPT
jgi:hypothetical protein